MTTIAQIASGEARCLNCVFWKKAFGKIGTCRRFAPMVGDGDSEKWPLTSVIDFCGEHETLLEE